MKKITLKVSVILALAAMVPLTSCIGSFALTNKLMSWNRTVSSKFVNELIFFAFWVLPVYEVTALADVVVLNSIEFWSGDNPIAKGKRVIEGQDGRYLVECDGRGYTITSENDKIVTRLDFDAEDRSWSVTDTEGKTVKLMTFIDDRHVDMITPNGDYTRVELSEQGCLAYQAIATSAPLFAAR